MRIASPRLQSLRDPTAILVAVPVSIVIVVGTALSLRAHSLLRRDRELVVHSYQVLGASDRILLSLADAETAQRGYVLTGDTGFLEPYEKAKDNDIPKQLETLQQLLLDSQTQEKRVSDLRTLSDLKLTELSQSITMFQKQGFPATQSFISARAGKDLMDQIRRVVSEIEASESRLVERRSAEVHEDEHQILVVAVVSTCLSTLLRIGIAVWRRRVAKTTGQHQHETNASIGRTLSTAPQCLEATASL